MRRWSAQAALLPLAVTVAVAYLGAMAWTLAVSFTSSRTFPNTNWVGWAQYERLFDNERWQLALHNLALYAVLFVVASLVIGTLLAVALDRQVRAAAALRTVFLYPYALSFVATGLVWQWVMNPEAGLQPAVQRLGFDGFVFDWITDPDRVLYTIVIATTWQAAGLVMALVLAGLRGVDAEIWQAARVEGIPAWRTYAQLVLPTLGPSYATATVMLAAAAAKLFDAVVAMTQGGPGGASDVPATFVMDHLFGRANIALASAGSVVMLVSVLAIAAPVLHARRLLQQRSEGAA